MVLRAELGLVEVVVVWDLLVLHRREVQGSHLLSQGQPILWLVAEVAERTLVVAVLVMTAEVVAVLRIVMVLLERQTQEEAVVVQAEVRVMLVRQVVQASWLSPILRFLMEIAVVEAEHQEQEELDRPEQLDRQVLRRLLQDRQE
jgi:hypothetical protein